MSRRIKSTWQPHRWTIVAGIAGIAVCSAIMVFLTRAAIPGGAFEAEDMQLTKPAVPISDADANGGQAVAFAAGDTTDCSKEIPGPLRSDKSFRGITTGVTVPYSIYLPEGYYTSCKTYPVVYSLHGKGEDNSSFMPPAELIRNAMADGVLDQAIVVTPDSYSDGRWEDSDKGPAESNFIKELIPHIESNYRVKKGASYRLLTGFSMGGHGAFRFGVKYPQMFAAVLSFDGAMSGGDAYNEFVPDVKQYQPKIITIGAQLCGARVKAVVDAYAGQGVTIPYEYIDMGHSYSQFLDHDRARGWKSVKFLQQHLGRTM